MRNARVKRRLCAVSDTRASRCSSAGGQEGDGGPAAGRNGALAMRECAGRGVRAAPLCPVARSPPTTDGRCIRAPNGFHTLQLREGSGGRARRSNARPTAPRHPDTQTPTPAPRPPPRALGALCAGPRALPASPALRPAARGEHLRGRRPRSAPPAPTPGRSARAGGISPAGLFGSGAARPLGGPDGAASAVAVAVIARPHTGTGVRRSASH